MPELPEAETIARGLDRLAHGRRLLKARVLTAGICERRLKFPVGAKVRGASRRAKKVLLTFEGDTTLMISLGMTGQVLRRDGHGLPPHTHLVLTFDRGLELLYVDPRRLGRLDPARVATTMLASAAEVAAWCDSRFGAEPLETMWPAFKRLVGGRKKVFKQLFLEQRPIAGLGNIYADEVLFRAGVHPKARPADLNDEELKRVWREMRAVLRQAIRACGTTFRDYRTATGASGDFVKSLYVYGRAGGPCRRCGHPIVRMNWPAGRSTHFCPTCQPER
jgi:formamidopyrimidine-DNA glycosylase